MSVTRRWSCAHAIPTSSTKAIVSAALALMCQIINEFIVIVVIPRKHPSRPDRSRCYYLEISPLPKRAYHRSNRAKRCLNGENSHRLFTRRAKNVPCEKRKNERSILSNFKGIRSTTKRTEESLRRIVCSNRYRECKKRHTHAPRKAIANNWALHLDRRCSPRENPDLR